MKAKKKMKSHSKQKAARLPAGMHQTQTVSKSRIRKEKPSNRFTPMETGAPDQDVLPGSEIPDGTQGGGGPLNMEGEGDRQNDQLAELQSIEPDPADPALMDQPSGLSGVPNPASEK